MERSCTIDLSRRLKISLTAAISKSWAKILPRRHISGHRKIVLGNIIPMKVKQNFVGKILGKIKIFVQDFCSHKNRPVSMVPNRVTGEMVLDGGGQFIPARIVGLHTQSL